MARIFDFLSYGAYLVTLVCLVGGLFAMILTMLAAVFAIWSNVVGDLEATAEVATWTGAGAVVLFLAAIVAQWVALRFDDWAWSVGERGPSGDELG